MQNHLHRTSHQTKLGVLVFQGSCNTEVVDVYLEPVPLSAMPLGSVIVLDNAWVSSTADHPKVRKGSRMGLPIARRNCEGRERGQKDMLSRLLCGLWQQETSGFAPGFGRDFGDLPVGHVRQAIPPKKTGQGNESLP